MLSDLIHEIQKKIASQVPGTDEYFASHFELMRQYGLTGRIQEAEAVLEMLMGAMASMEPKARAALVVATCIEKTGDFPAAIVAYRRVISILSDPRCDASDFMTVYFAHNNLAYSLNQVGSFREAELQARVSIQTVPGQYNAHKNLGVALAGQARFAEAVSAYARATQLEPMDRRALKHLEDLLRIHPEVLVESPALTEDVEAARSALRHMTKRLASETN